MIHGLNYRETTCITSTQIYIIENMQLIYLKNSNSLARNLLSGNDKWREQQENSPVQNPETGTMEIWNKKKKRA